MSGWHRTSFAMKVLLVWGAVLLVSVLNGYAAPTEDAPVANCAEASVPGEAPKSDPEVAPSLLKTVPAGYRKETLASVSKNSSLSKIESKTKEKKKVKVKHLKNGNTVTIIKDKIRSKTKKDELSDEYSQTNHTIEQGGIEDSTRLTTEEKRRLREVDVHKKLEKERIVTDRYGNVISDTVKVKEKDKVKKKEKDTRTSELVHTVKRVPPGAAADNPPELAPAEPKDKVKDKGEPTCGC